MLMLCQVSWSKEQTLVMMHFTCNTDVNSVSTDAKIRFYHDADICIVPDVDAVSHDVVKNSKDQIVIMMPMYSTYTRC